MKKSETIGSIGAALATFHLKVEKVAKDANNPFFKSKYATLENILDVIAVPLAESGLSFAQFPTGNYGLSTILIHGESGEYLEDEFYMEPAKHDPQGAGSVITYQRRYALASILGLAQEDDDANTGTHGGKTPEDAENNKPWLNKGTKEFEGAVEKLAAGQTTIDKIRQVRKISKEVETLLNNAVKNLQHAN